MRSLRSRHRRVGDVRQSQSLGQRSRLSNCVTDGCSLNTLGRRGPAPLRHDGRGEGTKWVLGQTAPHHAILSTAPFTAAEKTPFSSTGPSRENAIFVNWSAIFVNWWRRRSWLAQNTKPSTSHKIKRPPPPADRVIATSPLRGAHLSQSRRHLGVRLHVLISLHSSQRRRIIIRFVLGGPRHGSA